MLNQANKRSINRVIDANINRAKEGLRVCEDIARFVLDSRSLTFGLKMIRHKVSELSLSLAPRSRLLRQRCSGKDVGRLIRANELNRGGIKDIFFANVQRAKESVRVLEEFSKLFDKKAALGFKALRYKLYEIEKKALGNK